MARQTFSILLLACLLPCSHSFASDQALSLDMLDYLAAFDETETGELIDPLNIEQTDLQSGNGRNPKEQTPETSRTRQDYE